MTSFLRPGISGLSEYHLAQYPHSIKLNQNENPYELPLPIKQEILDRLATARWSRYPAFVPAEQIDMLASFAGWVPEGILLGNGSNDLLQLIFMATLERGRTMVLSQPTFTLYKLLALGLGAGVREVLMRPDLSFDVDGIIQSARTSHASLIVLCSPNNPTGTLMAEQDVMRIIGQTEALVVLDEAYVHFAPGSLCHILKESDRVVVLQTFSKAMGAAGLRFGYALMPVGLARELNKIKLPYSVNIFTLIAAEVLMRRWPALEQWIKLLVDERERVSSVLATLPGVKVFPSSANFLLVELLDRAPRDVFQDLVKRGILIRDVSTYPMLQRCVRISTGTPEENDAVLQALKEVL
jgi:histidinol-phosphate aminotransferase